MSESKNIYQRINAVMKKVDYIKKESEVGFGNSKYKAITHDSVIAEVRRFFVEFGIVVYPEQIKGEILIQRDLTKEIKMHLYDADYLIHFVNMDDPNDRISVSINAHANDNGDKAPGKCVTYATKTAIIKVLCLETGVNDESRAEAYATISEIQVTAINNMLTGLDGDVKDRMLGSLSIESVEEMPKTQYNKMIKSLQNYKKMESKAND